MSTNLDEHGQTLRHYPPHYAAAAIAVAGAVAVQLGWLEIWNRPAVDSWWPLDLALLLAATMYLLALAQLHFRSSTWRPNELVPRLWLLGQALGWNLIIAVHIGFVLAHGSAANVARAGLWIVPPAMLAAVVASALALGLALRDGWLNRFFSDIPPEAAPHGKPRSGLAHGILAVLLLLAIYLIEEVEPKYVPPQAIQPAATSPASDRTPPPARPLSPPPPAAK